MTPTDNALLPDLIWVKRNEDDIVSCDFVADTDPCIFTNHLECEKYIKKSTVKELIDLLRQDAGPFPIHRERIKELLAKIGER